MSDNSQSKQKMSDNESIDSNFAAMVDFVSRMHQQLTQGVQFPPLESVKPLVESSQEYINLIIEENKDDNSIPMQSWTSVIENIWGSWVKLLWLQRFLDYDWTLLMETLEEVACHLEQFLEDNMTDEDDMTLDMLYLKKIGERSADLFEDEATSAEQLQKTVTIIERNKNRAAAAFELKMFVEYLQSTGQEQLYQEFLQRKGEQVREGVAPDTNVNLDEILHWAQEGR
jgi:hypothetical protein